MCCGWISRRYFGNFYFAKFTSGSSFIADPVYTDYAECAWILTNVINHIFVWVCLQTSFGQGGWNLSFKYLELLEPLLSNTTWIESKTGLGFISFQVRVFPEKIFSTWSGRQRVSGFWLLVTSATASTASLFTRGRFFSRQNASLHFYSMVDNDSKADRIIFHEFIEYLRFGQILYTNICILVNLHERIQFYHKWLIGFVYFTISISPEIGVSVYSGFFESEEQDNSNTRHAKISQKVFYFQPGFHT